MATVNKISGVSFSTNVSAVDGVSKSSIGSINGISAPPSQTDPQTDYVSTGLEFHVNANDTNSWNGTTTWTDLAGTEDMTLVNGPTKPSGADYVAFDGNDDYGDISFSSGDYFYGSSSNYTFWNTLSIQAVGSFPEDGSTGFVHNDAFILAIDRYQASNMRGLSVYFGRRGIQFNLFYGTVINIGYPNTSDFQYNSSRGFYEPIPDQVYSFALTMDRTSSPHLTAYINGSTFTPSVVTGSCTQVGSSSTVNSTYINNSAVRRGNGRWTYQIFQSTTGGVGASGYTANYNEYMMYSTELSASQVQQNYDAYTDRYGALN